MNVTYYKDMEQGSDEWLLSRLGIVTASEMNNLITPTGKLAAGKKVQAYACEIASQRANMQIEDSFQSFDMMRGTFHEEYARDSYNDNYEAVEECGFVLAESSDDDKGIGFKIGGSPDGLVGEDGMIEIKSRLPKFQVATIVADEVPAEYINQIQAMLLITGRDWCDFIQYSTGMPLFVKRAYPDVELQYLIMDAVQAFEPLVVKMQEVYTTASKNMIQTERVDFIIDDVITESKGE